MTASLLALTGLAAWSLFLLSLIAVLRVSLTLSGKKAANAFAVDGSDVSPFANRLARAHANCYENLPIFASLVLVAAVLGKSFITDPLALWYLAARIGQSTTHLISTSVLAVQVRFFFFLVQFLILVWWAFRLLSVGLAS